MPNVPMIRWGASPYLDPGGEGHPLRKLRDSLHIGRPAWWALRVREDRAIGTSDTRSLGLRPSYGHLIAAGAARRTQQRTESPAPLVLAHGSKPGSYPTVAEIERAMILAAY